VPLSRRAIAVDALEEHAGRSTNTNATPALRSAISRATSSIDHPHAIDAFLAGKGLKTHAKPAS